MSVATYWGMTCPGCGADDALEIQAAVWVSLAANGTDIDDGEDASHEWEPSSPCKCTGCGWSGTVADAGESAGDGVQPDSGRIDGLWTVQPCDGPGGLFSLHDETGRHVANVRSLRGTDEAERRLLALICGAAAMREGLSQIARLRPYGDGPDDTAPDGDDAMRVLGFHIQRAREIMAAVDARAGGDA